MDLTTLTAKPGLKLALGLGLALILAVVIGWLFWSRASLKGDLTQAEANVATLQGVNRAKAKAIEELQKYARTTDNALTQRDKALQQITAQRAALRQQMEEVMRNDPKTRAWADEPLPAAVRQLLP
jgi:LysB family phage lysis regulatory protein